MLSMTNIFIDKGSVARAYGNKTIFPLGLAHLYLGFVLEGLEVQGETPPGTVQRKLVICTVVFKHCIATLPNRKTTAATVGDKNTISRSLLSIVRVLVLEV